ncbi:fructosamine kinase family protein, partial [Staphylococcus epidermidis]
SFDNTWSESWSEIFVERRMDHLRDELLRKNLWNEEDNKVYEQVRSVMIHELENHNSKPSLLHGDLWGGNYM